MSELNTKVRKTDVIIYYLKNVWDNVSYENLVKYMYRPKDPSSLGVIRFLFGLLMLVDLPEERGGADLDIRWGDPKDCHFPLFSFLKPPSFPYMVFFYGIMWLGALGIMLGYKFRISTILFAVPYWYILLSEKSFWNNHSYLFGIVAILLVGTSANNFLSIDGILDKSKRNSHVPYWNYFILKFQFFLLYFLAGLKKTDFEWLEGYSMTNLGTHWVFRPFQLILSSEQIDYLIVHWFGFLLDLTIGFWMIIETTRPIAMLFCAAFHLMNSRLFSIGMFPYVCLATMPLFCEETWPKKIISPFTKTNLNPTPSSSCVYSEREIKEYNGNKNDLVILESNIKWKHKFVVALLLSHCGLQGFLPYSHFITKGYNNWTNGLYGYSWDMMIHSWETVLVVIKVVDNQSGEEYFLDSTAYVQNQRWNKHADMCLQYAHCIKDNILLNNNNENIDGDDNLVQPHLKQAVLPNYKISDDISVYIDVWCSLNGRFQQRMYNPNYDLLKANWSPFEPVEWLLPILSEYNDFRRKMTDITEQVYAWSNHSNVLFIADFPGLFLENFIGDDLKNVTLTVLEGEVFYEIEDEVAGQSVAVKLSKGESFPVEANIFHKIHTVSSTPSCYMYTYTSTPKNEEDGRNQVDNTYHGMYSPFPILEDVEKRYDLYSTFFEHVYSSFKYLLFNEPLLIRTRGKSDK